MIDHFISGLDNKALVRKYCVRDIDLKFCLGCKHCYIDGNCVHSDNVKGISWFGLCSDCRTFLLGWRGAVKKLSSTERHLTATRIRIEHWKRVNIYKRSCYRCKCWHSWKWRRIDIELYWTLLRTPRYWSAKENINLSDWYSERFIV